MRTVVVGSGAAGLWCALQSSERGPVVLVAPRGSATSATAWAQGGIAAAVGPGDDPASHADDTEVAGAGLCDPGAVEVLTTQAPHEVRALAALGMPFDDGGALTLEGGHAARRVLHAGGDASGRVLLEFLAGRVAARADVERVDARVIALRTGSSGIVGVEVEGGRVVSGDRVVLATGGACGIFGRRTGPDSALGEGMALAWLVGAALADLEFVQFHPTALDVPGHPARLLTEALRGEGASLVDAAGARFMDRFDPRGDLAPRDVVARAVVQVRTETGRPVFLDATAIEGVSGRFPVAAAQCVEVGLDLTRDRIPVAPAAHYFTGGILTDSWGRSTVPGLLACGETACTGVHGANRLASNSLAEALVFGHRAAIADHGPMDDLRRGGWSDRVDVPLGSVAVDDVRNIADRLLGVERAAEGLTEAVRSLSSDVEPIDSATLIASLVAQAALRREESRGGHHRSDFPVARDSWLLRQAVSTEGWTTIPMTGVSSSRTADRRSRPAPAG